MTTIKFNSNRFIQLCQCIDVDEIMYMTLRKYEKKVLIFLYSKNTLDKKYIINFKSVEIINRENSLIYQTYNFQPFYMFIKSSADLLNDIIIKDIIINITNNSMNIVSTINNNTDNYDTFLKKKLSFVFSPTINIFLKNNLIEFLRTNKNNYLKFTITKKNNLIVSKVYEDFIFDGTSCDVINRNKTNCSSQFVKLDSLIKLEHTLNNIPIIQLDNLNKHVGIKYIFLDDSITCITEGVNIYGSKIYCVNIKTQEKILYEHEIKMSYNDSANSIKSTLNNIYDFVEKHFGFETRSSLEDIVYENLEELNKTNYFGFVLVKDGKNYSLYERKKIYKDNGWIWKNEVELAINDHLFDFIEFDDLVITKAS